MLTWLLVDVSVPHFTVQKDSVFPPWFSSCKLICSADYVILENLLLLVLIVAPKFDSASIEKRSNFMREVFVMNNPNDAICGESLAKILGKPTARDSDLLQAQAVDILAKSNLML